MEKPASRGRSNRRQKEQKTLAQRAPGQGAPCPLLRRTNMPGCCRFSRHEASRVLFSPRPGRAAAGFQNFLSSLRIFPRNLCIRGSPIFYLQPKRDTLPTCPVSGLGCFCTDVYGSSAEESPGPGVTIPPICVVDLTDSSPAQFRK